MATKNDITGDEIKTKVVTDAYAEGHDRIFKKKECYRCGKKLPLDLNHIHTCTPREGWVDYEEKK